MLRDIIYSMRPKQWTKNLIIFAPLVFDRQLTNVSAFLHILIGFVLYCLISGAVYLYNDLIDIEADKNHPRKAKRPIASGRLKPNIAMIVFALLLAITLPVSFLLSPVFGAFVSAYLLLMILYTRWLKHIVLIDVLIIATGFVLRVAGGVSLIQVERFSPWLYVVVTLGALYLGFGKRRAELALLNSGAQSHRRVLDGYTIEFLDQLIMIVSSTTIIAYSLYTFSAVNLPANHAMMLTIPFVLYGIFRYLYLIQVAGEGGAPEDLLLTDRPLQATILLWGLAILLIFYFL